MLFRRPYRRKRAPLLKDRRVSKKRRVKPTAGQMEKAAAIVIAVISLLAFVALAASAAGAIGSAAVAKARGVAVKALDECVSARLADGSLAYNELITLEKNKDGYVAVMTADMAKMNALENEMIDEIVQMVSALGSADIKIPLGTLTGISLLEGKGALLPCKVVPLTSSSAQFRNEFTAAGENRTTHEIILEIAVDVNILVPGQNIRKRISAEVTVAQSVFAGNVPDSYVDLTGIA